MTPEEFATFVPRRARDLMDREYDRPLDAAEIALAALMSTAHFSRHFKATYGETPYTYLMTRRIERAKALLRRGDMSVTEVCFAVGCTSLAHSAHASTRSWARRHRPTGHVMRAGLRACRAASPGTSPDPAADRQDRRSARGARAVGFATWISLSHNALS